MQLLDAIGHFFGRVEVVLAGGDEELRAGEEALARREPMRARVHARHLLDRLPGSPLGLALLADACEMGGLDAELALTLEELAGRVPSRAEVWVRLARARRRTSAAPDEVRDALVRALSVAEPGSESRREALVSLADLDLAQGDGARAELWLERIVERRSSVVALRRAEARLLRGDAAGARKALENVEDDPTDARAALTRGRALAVAGDGAAFAPLLRAYVLEGEGASELLSSTLAWVPSDEATRDRVRTVVADRGESGLARWRAAFARAEGKRDDARAALKDALGAGDATAARPLLDAALDDHDEASLAVALDALRASAPADPPDPVLADALRLPALSVARAPETAGAALDALRAVHEPRVAAFAASLRAEAARAWLPPSGAPAAWGPLLARLDEHARAAHDLDAIARLAELAVERTRPVRLAIVGEFNAGKSTFINALMGQDVAPTGVLPTTATLHHLRYGPDPIARIAFEPGHAPPERIVPLADLRATLKRVADEPVRRVELLLPLASLTRVEVLDTPGFNAPDARHAEAARAAFDEADAVVWLLDAMQPLKQTERVVLEEAKRARIPIQVLVNKADRLQDEDLAKVMAMVEDALREIGVASWAPPLALSARLALAGRLGDAAALATSRWENVQRLLDEQIVGRSEELKERALRRRASRVVELLRASSGRAARAEEAEAAAAADRARRLALAAATLDRDAEDVARKLAVSLEPSTRAWRKDLAVVVTGREREVAETDPALLRYAVERALARVAPRLADALAALSGEARLAPPDLSPLARALVRQLAFASGRTVVADASATREPEERVTTASGSSGTAGASATATATASGSGSAPASAAAPAPAPAPSAVSLSLARAAVASLVEHLGALATAPPPRAAGTGLEAELAALAEALA